VFDDVTHAISGTKIREKLGFKELVVTTPSKTVESK